jgi:heme exporter protein C
MGIIMLRRSFDDTSEGAKVTAVLILVGLINIPIIKFSVDWWNTLHQGASVIRLDGPTIHPSMLRPLLISALGFTALSFWLWMEAIENTLLQRRLEKRQRQLAWQEDEGTSKGHLA